MLWIVFVVVVGIALLFYCIWSYANPDRLQTEEFLLEQQRMLIGDERHPGAPVIDNVPLISNTAKRGPKK
jgi:hypothetical protein